MQSVNLLSANLVLTSFNLTTFHASSILCLANSRAVVCLQRSCCCCCCSRPSLSNLRLALLTSRDLCSTTFDSWCPTEAVLSSTVQLMEVESSSLFWTIRSCFLLKLTFLYFYSLLLYFYVLAARALSLAPRED